VSGFRPRSKHRFLQVIRTAMKTLADPSWALLQWDSDHLGFPVAKIEDPNLDDLSLRRTLTAIRREGACLVYWPASGDREISPHLLREFSGSLLDRRVTFERKLKAEEITPLLDLPPISEFPKAAPTRQLLDLAVAAGVHSRFAVDRRFPRDKFVQLYEEWMRNSTLGEMADCVLGAFEAGPFSACFGMITLSYAEDEGRIGLIAVQAKLRGKGIGLALMAEAWAALWW
jgi:dTDP-4-amino-4,6-dideoxy-D-galactose acyltransferase